MERMGKSKGLGKGGISIGRKYPWYGNDKNF